MYKTLEIGEGHEYDLVFVYGKLLISLFLYVDTVTTYLVSESSYLNAD